MEKNFDQPPPYSGPPPPGFVPPQPQQHSHLPQQPHINAVPFQFGPDPQNTVCPSCNAHIKTRVTLEPNSTTHLSALLLCLFQCYLCCLLPYCIDSCQNRNHYCPNCQAYLGTYN